MTPSTTAASSVAMAQGTHDLKAAVRASTTAAIETPRFTAKIVAIHSLYIPARAPKPTSAKPIRISTPNRTRAAVRSAARSAAARIARTSFGRMLGPWRQTLGALIRPGSRNIDHAIRRGEARDHLEAVAEVVADLDGLHHH